jgi:hypothetical protein
MALPGFAPSPLVTLADYIVCAIKGGQFWGHLKPYRGKTKTNGQSGKNRRFYEWDYTHGDVEVYDARGNHMGSADPETGGMTKPPVPGRKINL